MIGNLSECVVQTADQLYSLLRKGDSSLHVGETNMNKRSSRSHNIFRLGIESRPKIMEPLPIQLDEDAGDLSSLDIKTTTKTVNSMKSAYLNLVDLAGSERVGHTGAEGLRLKEGGHINKSLLTLGTVIAKLSENSSDGVHVPFRDSKLTRILQTSLGGNAKTAIICTITPASLHADETLSTLKFANRAKTIRNRPKINDILTEESLLHQYRCEIVALRKRLQAVLQTASPQVASVVVKIDANPQGQSVGAEKSPVVSRIPAPFPICISTAETTAMLPTGFDDAPAVLSPLEVVNRQLIERRITSGLTLTSPAFHPPASSEPLQWTSEQGVVAKENENLVLDQSILSMPSEVRKPL